MRSRRALAAAATLALAGCQPPSGGSGTSGGPAPPGEPVGAAGGGAAQVAAWPAGASCQGTAQCPEGQVCVQAVCRYARGSRAGEILAAGARGQLEAGDAAGAIGTFEQAIEAFAAAAAPLPPEVACGAAAAALRAQAGGEERERAARHADRCFRLSLPGDGLRLDVQRRLAQMRFDGLRLASFDEAEAPGRFFTEEPSRPTADAIEIALDLAEQDAPGYAQLAVALGGEPAQRAITECFIQHWERSHERAAAAALVLSLETRMRDMGDYDAYEPTVAVTEPSRAEAPRGRAGAEGPGADARASGFAGCVAAGLTEALQPGPRLGRTLRWQEPFAVAARVR